MLTYAGDDGQIAVGGQYWQYDFATSLFVPLTSPLQLSCVGFEPPMDRTRSVKKRNRVLPLKMELIDDTDTAITDFDIVALPLVEVDISPAGDVTEPAGEVLLSAGQGDSGNQFVFSGVSWDFNLQTKNFSGEGTYTITAVSGDPTEYVIDPTCEATFIIE